MAAPTKTKGGKAKKAPGAARSRIQLYKIDGSKLTRGSRFCPKCGQGIFMASHKDRYTCGKCNYMEKK